MVSTRIDNALTHLKNAFLEAPGIRLTPDDVALLTGLEQPLCDALLGALEERRFLRRVEHGRFELFFQGEDGLR